MKNIKNIRVNSLLMLTLFLLLLLVNSCNYSFKGASPPEGIKTIFIPTIKDESGFGAANLAEDMTLLLKNKFIKFMLIFQIILVKLLSQILTEVNFKKGKRF